MLCYFIIDNFHSSLQNVRMALRIIKQADGSVTSCWENEKRGRKTLRPEQKRNTYPATVSPETQVLLFKIREKLGVDSNGRVLDHLVDYYATREMRGEVA